jgi:hypothetical protein
LRVECKTAMVIHTTMHLCGYREMSRHFFCVALFRNARNTVTRHSFCLTNAVPIAATLSLLCAPGKNDSELEKR